MNDSKRYALFRCCTSAPHMPEYEQATDIILEKLGLDVVQINEFGCCGYPLRNVDQASWLLASARNLALAEARGCTLITVCNCCYGTLKHCAWLLSRDQALHGQINRALRKEGLDFTGKARIRHLFEVLEQDVGIEHLRSRIVSPVKDLKLALHYGCRMLRPSKVLAMDSPDNPVLLDRLVETLDAVSLDWDKKSDCCGAQIMSTDEGLSEALVKEKQSRAVDLGADAICVACPFCQLSLGRPGQDKPTRPVITYPQLLAYCLGADVKRVGFTVNL